MDLTQRDPDAANAADISNDVTATASETTSNSRQRAPRYTYLDAVRGLAALAVVLTHYQYFLPGKFQPGRELLWPLYDNGGMAVQLFWVLSGVVFASVYSGQDVTGREFFIRRFARLYPLHFVTLLVMVVLEAVSRSTFGTRLLAHNDLQHFLLHLFLASNWWHELEFSFNGAIWSVSVEVLAYAAFFVLVLRLRWNSLAQLIAIAAVATSLALLTARYSLTSVALFFIGACVARTAVVLGRLHLPVGIFAFAAALALAFLCQSSRYSHHWQLVLYYCVFPSALLLVLTLDLSAPPLPAQMRWLGESTYSLYLLHTPIQDAMMMAFAASGVVPRAEQPWFLASYLTGLLVAAKLTYTYFEVPVQTAILRRWS